MKVHFRMYHVDGLNMDTMGFNWKHRILLTNSENPNGNIATAYVKVSHPMPKDIEIHLDDQANSLRLLTLFLSCYQLTTNIHMPEINTKSSGGFEIDEEEISLDKIRVKMNVNKSTNVAKIPHFDTMKYLNETMPFFEKVIKITETQKEQKLDVAMIMYYRSLITMESMEALIDRVTALEALFSDSSNELRYKIALRTAIFTENNPSNRRELFNILKKIYDARSKLVHGSDVSLHFIDEYRTYASILRNIVRTSLLNYVELSSKNKTKQEIIDHIDNLALGIR